MERKWIFLGVEVTVSYIICTVIQSRFSSLNSSNFSSSAAVVVFSGPSMKPMGSIGLFLSRDLPYIGEDSDKVSKMTALEFSSLSYIQTAYLGLT